jgi:hypothetical protein
VGDKNRDKKSTLLPYPQKNSASPIELPGIIIMRGEQIPSQTRGEFGEYVATYLLHAVGAFRPYRNGTIRPRGPRVSQSQELDGTAGYSNAEIPKGGCQMTEKAKFDKDRAKAWPFALPDMPEPLQMQAQAWFQEQAELLEGMQKMMAAWTKRRQEGMEASFRTVLKLYDCKDFGAVSAVCGEWLTGRMKRVMADMNDARDEARQLIELSQKSMLGTLSSPNPEAVKPTNEVPLRSAAE